MSNALFTLTDADRERARTLRRYKFRVTALLVLAALIYLACMWAEQSINTPPAWVGYVRAMSEAGLVGGLADWFAVTALFRYPMGIKIPHTAIIPNRKDELGESLAQFTGENFFNAEIITEKLRSLDLPLKAGVWLSQPENAKRVSRGVGTLGGYVVDSIRPEDAEAVIRTLLVEKAGAPLWAPPVGKFLEQFIADGKVEPMLQEALNWLHRKALGSEELILSLTGKRMPDWAPETLRSIAGALVGDKVYREIVKFTADMATDPEHEGRAWLRNGVAQFAEDLQHDPETIARIEGIKHDLLGSSTINDVATMLWNGTEAATREALGEENSLVRRKVAEYALEWGERLEHDPALREKTEQWIIGLADTVARNYSGEIASMISQTVESWDAKEASQKIELMVGKDLQFIRLNGTIVGSLAGLVIYTISQLLF